MGWEILKFPSKTKLAIIGLVVLGVAWQWLGKPPAEVLTLIVVAVSGLGGYILRDQVEEMRERTPVGTTFAEVKGVEWSRYWFRAIGYFLAFGGFGLIADELIGGYLDFATWGHEWIGVILFLVGLGLISVKPKGK